MRLEPAIIPRSSAGRMDRETLPEPEASAAAAVLEFRQMNEADFRPIG